MDDAVFDGEEVSLELDEETVARIDELAWADYRGNRETAIRDLLDEWLRREG
ncbi:MAG: ribbon-helix-helix protein, CopG family [Haloferacaceae archaeon]